MLRLGEEVNQQLELAGPLIVFFGLPEKEQVALLPVLEERKYDFPEGDLITSSALEVLVSGYKAYLNSIVIWLMIIQDESDNTNMEELIWLVDQLLETAHKIVEEHDEIIDNVDYLRTSEWANLRYLSFTLKQKLEIQWVANSEVIRNCMEYWLHP
ncbi:hypothetical protein [Trichothermofontia sp.]